MCITAQAEKRDWLRPSMQQRWQHLLPVCACVCVCVYVCVCVCVRVRVCIS
jgi:hypothetical protein